MKFAHSCFGIVMTGGMRAWLLLAVAVTAVFAEGDNDTDEIVDKDIVKAKVESCSG